MRCQKAAQVPTWNGGSQGDKEISKNYLTAHTKVTILKTGQGHRYRVQIEYTIPIISDSCIAGGCRVIPRWTIRGHKYMRGACQKSYYYD